MQRDETTLNQLSRRLLTSIRREVSRLRAIDLFSLGGDRRAVGEIRARVRDAQGGLIRLDLESWAGRALGDAARKAAHRALDRLADAGFIRRVVTDTGRTVAVRLLDLEVPK